MGRKLARISNLDEDTMSYTASAYLIAQLGKNFSVPKEKRIDGSVILNFALDTIEKLQYAVGGVLEFLECENKDILMNFYTTHKFKFFDVRTTTVTHGKEVHELNQLLKFI